jgi:hypothetical protein
MFKSEIIKTAFGLMTIRGLAGEVAKAANAVHGLSYVDKNEANLKVLARTFTSAFYQMEAAEANKLQLNHNQLMVGEGVLRNGLNRHYEYSKAKHGVTLLGIEDGIHPHMLRHTFAEFALRRFDGNVIEEIRNHYRHSYGSYMTKKYTDNKLRVEEQILLENEYIAELVGRIGNRPDEFSGPIAAFIKRRINETHELLTIDEIEERICDEVESIVGHEWGYCIVIAKTKTEANCYNKKTKVPEIEKSSSFLTCSTCKHRLTEKSQKEDILRIGLTHQNFIDNYPLPSVTKSSRKVVSNCNAILKEIRSAK